MADETNAELGREYVLEQFRSVVGLMEKLLETTEECTNEYNELESVVADVEGSLSDFEV